VALLLAVATGEPVPAAQVHRVIADTQTAPAIVAAGGGAHFKTTVLLSVLFGAKVDGEFAKLTDQFGAAAVKQSVTTLDFIVARAARARPWATASPAPDRMTGPGLAAALYAAGTDPATGTYDTRRMLDGVLSRPLHARLTRDVVATYGFSANITFENVLRVVMRDLKATYSL
jgi:hypothetical protein